MLENVYVHIRVSHQTIRFALLNFEHILIEHVTIYTSNNTIVNNMQATQARIERTDREIKYYAAYVRVDACYNLVNLREKMRERERGR
jgi:hypothetical protein